MSSRLDDLRDLPCRNPLHFPRENSTAFCKTPTKQVRLPAFSSSTFRSCCEGYPTACLAEVENCQISHTPESCLQPLSYIGWYLCSVALPGTTCRWEREVPLQQTKVGGQNSWIFEWYTRRRLQGCIFCPAVTVNLRCLWSHWHTELSLSSAQIVQL
jgi:hypothetical protein